MKRILVVLLFIGCVLQGAMAQAEVFGDWRVGNLGSPAYPNPLLIGQARLVEDSKLTERMVVLFITTDSPLASSSGVFTLHVMWEGSKVFGDVTVSLGKKERIISMKTKPYDGNSMVDLSASLAFSFAVNPDQVIDAISLLKSDEVFSFSVATPPGFNPDAMRSDGTTGLKDGLITATWSVSGFKAGVQRMLELNKKGR